MSIFFTGDTHFGHTKIIQYCKRPFKTADEMNEEIVRRWNSVVGSKDDVYHVGDFAFMPAAQARAIRKRLNGRIFLIEGNHDNGTNYDFEWIKPYYELWVGDQEIVLFHYGMRTWHHDLRGTWHLYGHSHGMLPPYGKSMDVGVDCWSFSPITFEFIQRTMAIRPMADHLRF
jgi:calcineurin-like phosphoesterase family protein